MANFRDIIVFDFETGGANPHTCQPTQIAAVAIHARKLEPSGKSFLSFAISTTGKRHPTTHQLLLATISMDTICLLSSDYVSSMARLTKRRVVKKSLTQSSPLMSCNIFIVGLKTIRTLRVTAWITCEIILE